MFRNRVASLVLLIALAGCASKEAFLELREEAAACSTGESCVFAGGSDCICPAPVNASRAEEINEEVKSVSCVGEGRVECRYGRESKAACVDRRCQPAPL